MKVSLNDEELFTLSEIQKKVIKNDILEEIFDSDMKRRLEYIVNHPCERFIDQNKKSAFDYLKSIGVKSVPTDRIEFSELVFQHAPVTLSDREKQDHCVKVDGQECFQFSQTKKKLLKSSVAKDCCCIEWMKERLKFILIHKYERCFMRLKKEWEPKLQAKGIKSIPIDEEDFAKVVFSQPDYKSRSDREKSDQGIS